jgi:hypothetical protein
MGHAPLDEAAADAIVDLALRVLPLVTEITQPFGTEGDRRAV